jgi:hypothetical protein
MNLKDVEVSIQGLIEGTIPAYTWRTHENHEILSQESLSADRDLNPGSPKYEALMLTTRPRPELLIV